MLALLAVTKTGLRKDEIREILEVNVDLVDKTLQVFSFCLVCHNGLYRMNNEVYKRTVSEVYLKEEMFRNEIHLSIETVLHKNKGFYQSVRLIDEVAYHIFK